MFEQRAWPNVSLTSRPSAKPTNWPQLPPKSAQKHGRYADSFRDVPKKGIGTHLGGVLLISIATKVHSHVAGPGDVELYFKR